MPDVRGIDARHRPLLALACFVLAHLVLFAIVFSLFYTIRFSGTPLYYDDATKLLMGLVPYRDFTLEYPPLAMAFFTLPKLAGAGFAPYYYAYQVLIVLCDLAIVVALFGIARRHALNVWLILGAYTVAILAVGPIVRQQYDLLPAALTILAIYFATSNRPAAAWSMLALGTMAKVYPLLLAPVFAMPDLQRRSLGRLRRPAIAFGLTCLAVMLPLILVAPTSIASFFAYHQRRGIQIESTYASVLLLIDKLHLTFVGMEMSFGSWNVGGTAADITELVTTPVFLVGLALAYSVVHRRMRDDVTSRYDPTTLGTCALLVVLVTLVTSKVLSPQYLIWVTPLLPLAVTSVRARVWVVFALAGPLTYYIFPAHYRDLIFHDSGVVIAALLIRNGLLVLAALLAARSLRVPRPAAGTP